MTGFEKLICTSDTTQYFMSLCYIKRNWFSEIWYDWQTLTAGVLAVIAALWTARYLKKQIAIQQQSLNAQKDALQAQLDKDERETEQRRKVVLIAVPQALADILNYARKAFDAWEIGQVKTRTKQPGNAVRIIMKAAPYVDEYSFESFMELIVHLQVFESRLDSEGQKNIDNLLNIMIVDIAILSYLTTRLFRYSRLQNNGKPIIYEPPSREDLMDELIKYFGFRVKTDEGLQSRINNGMNLYFGNPKYQTE